MSRPVMVGEYVIERHHFRWVEEELRRQPYRLARIKSLEERFGGESELDIILGTPPREPGMPGSPNLGNPTLSKVTALMCRQELTQLRAVTNAIQEVYGNLPPLEQDIIRMLYFERRYTLDGVAFKLEKDVKTIIKHRNKAILAFALALIGDRVVSNSSKTPVLRQKTVL